MTKAAFVEMVTTDQPDAPAYFLLVYCAGGYRSSIAASVLQEHGFDRVQEIAGGLSAWEAAGLPVEL